MTERRDERIPEWKLERLALGELPGEQMRALRRRLDVDPDGRARMAAIDASNEEILAQYEPEKIVREIEGRLHMAKVAASVAARAQRKTWMRGIAIVAPVLAGAAAAVMALSGPNDRPTEGVGDMPIESGIILKGDPQLIMHRQLAGEKELLSAGATARLGDVLQISYRAANRQFGVIVSIDGRGEVTRHLPDGQTAAELEQGGLFSLTHSYELDDAPDFERFFFVTSNEPFSVEAVLAAAESMARQPLDAQDEHSKLALPEGLQQTTFVVRKVGQP